jgi:hypothetical protein
MRRKAAVETHVCIYKQETGCNHAAGEFPSSQDTCHFQSYAAAPPFRQSCEYMYPTLFLSPQRK